MAGLTSAGFEAKTLADIQAEIEADFKASFGASIDVTAQSVFGQLIGIISEREAESGSSPRRCMPPSVLTRPWGSSRTNWPPSPVPSGARPRSPR